MSSEDKNRRIQLVITDDGEWARYLEVLRRAKNSDPTLKNSDVNRILLGLAPPSKDVTAGDIEYFRTGKTEVGRGRVGKTESRPADKAGRKANGGQKG